MLISLDFSDVIPIYLQIRNQIVAAIADGTLRAGDHLPAIRALADEIGVNMMTVSKAYQLLKQEGYLVTDRRSGTRIAERHGREISASTVRELKLKICELRAAGLQEDDVMQLCRRLYKEEEK